MAKLAASANRKMMHEDGAGCLADLNALEKIEPEFRSQYAVTRGQCEMLVGRCQAGKRRVANWYEREMAMSPERARISAESLGSMRCRGGDSSERDQLLGALYDLSDAAYVNRRSPDYCASRVATARRLLPKVKARSFDDGQIEGGGRALFHTAAACYARAGDCRAAERVYGELFPVGSMGGLSAAQRKQAISDSFDSSIERCAN